MMDGRYHDINFELSGSFFDSLLDDTPEIHRLAFNCRLNYDDYGFVQVQCIGFTGLK